MGLGEFQKLKAGIERRLRRLNLAQPIHSRSLAQRVQNVAPVAEAFVHGRGGGLRRSRDGPHCEPAFPSLHPQLVRRIQDSYFDLRIALSAHSVASSFFRSEE